MRSCMMQLCVYRGIGGWHPQQAGHVYCVGTDALLAVICRSVCYNYKNAIEKHGDRSEW